ncbi:MAG: hypothetical protein Kow0069_24910 [Promethearchaeota archaeon]
MVSVVSLPVSCLFFAFSGAIAWYAMANRHRPEKEKHLRNEVLVAFLFAMAGGLYPFIFVQTGVSNSVQGALYLISDGLLFGEMGVWGATFLKGRLACRDPEVRRERDYETFRKRYLAEYKYDFGKDVKRKLLHVLPVAVIFFFWSLGAWLEGRGTLARFGLTQPAFSFWLIVTVGYGFVLMFATADLARLTGHGHLLPGWAVRWFTSGMKADELDTFISSESMVLSFVPFVFTPFPVFASVASITAVADAAASLVGKRFGRHKFFETSQKTIEGYVAGGFACFVLVLLMCGLYRSAWIDWVTAVAMAVFATFLFLSVDAFAKHVSDNILNPLLCGAGMVLAIALF